MTISIIQKKKYAKAFSVGLILGLLVCAWITLVRNVEGDSSVTMNHRFLVSYSIHNKSIKGHGDLELSLSKMPADEKCRFAIRGYLQKEIADKLSSKENIGVSPEDISVTKITTLSSNNHTE